MEGSELAHVSEENPSVIGACDNVYVVIGTHGDILKASGTEEKCLYVPWSDLDGPKSPLESSKYFNNCWLYG